MRKTIEIDVPAGFKAVLGERDESGQKVEFVRNDEYWKDITSVYALNAYVRDSGVDDWRRDIFESITGEDDDGWTWVKERVADCLELQLLHGVIEDGSTPLSVDEKRYFPYPDGDVTCSTMRGVGLPWFLAYSTLEKAKHVASHFGALLKNYACGGQLTWK